ncbi:hypothetical protein CKO44_17480 [Rubrivivax gelatinosus]|uniref:tetratricopeptide repeat protein n=1 Tax=Rubrivivax gelatinosus TaxID=28068 RepID=UPI001906E0AC|nr:tetratricopeptide repeat protein [Rubrivivax gelatinosus]MBK1615256.1 hypothetical protein [Rubrivivax gelatinosus]
MLRVLIAALALALVPLAHADDAADAQRLLLAGQADAALARAETALAQRPNDATLRFTRGVALLDLGRDAEAQDAFLRMTQDFPELPEPYNNLGLLYARAGRLEDARVALETALRNDPSQRIARRNLGDVMLRLALQSWEAAAAATPGDPELERRIRVARELAASPR